jgi:hypothetical protein
VLDAFSRDRLGVGQHVASVVGECGVAHGVVGKPAFAWPSCAVNGAGPFLRFSILSNNKRVCSVSKLVKNAATGRYECRSTLFVRDGRCDYKTEQHIDMRLVLVLLLLLTGYAQWLNYPTAGVPHLPNGQPNLTAPPTRTPEGKPDFTGLWEPEYKRWNSIINLPNRRGISARGMCFGCCAASSL